MSHLCFKRNFWDKGIAHTKILINYPSTEYKRRHFEEFVVPKYNISAQTSFAVLHIKTWWVSAYMTFVIIYIKLNAPSLKYAHVQMRFVRSAGGHDFHFWINYFFEQNNWEHEVSWALKEQSLSTIFSPLGVCVFEVWIRQADT